MEERKSLFQYEKFDESIKRLKEDILLQILSALQISKLTGKQLNVTVA